ncbi:uncharacterized protein LOC135462920 isoform X3 [Liolophura sinensis]|uniref:uncharacterized protein LOC135462920 isoform X3 n=1 Tax=Liolophura sinensis TaxID=3198878 RepID=UPI003158EB4A
MTTQLLDKTQTPTELWSISADTSSNSVTTLIPNKTQTPKELSSIPADISSTTMSTQIPDKMKPPTELSSISDEHSTDIPVPCKIQASDLNADSKGLDNRALTVGVAVGVGEAVIGIVIVAIILVVQRYRHSQNGTHRESGATDEYCYENEDFVVENRRRNRPCPEVASETERPQSVYSVDDTYDQISFS